jgi:protein TonB
MTRIQAILVGGSLALHLGIGVWMGFLPKEKKTDSVAIALSESKKKKDEAKPAPPPPPPPPAPAAKAKIAAAAPKPAALEPPPPVAAPPPRVAAAGDAPSAMDGFADLGLVGGGNGMALPGGPGRGAAPAAAAAAPAPAVRKVKELAPAADECKEDAVKPQLDHQTAPAYTSEGRQASVEGVVKLEVTVDENGRVTAVRVLKGLGFGLDESAVAAARQWTFKPATKCGKPVSYVVKPGVRFQLGS